MPTPPDSGLSLVNLGAYAEPANTLIERVSDLIGGFLTPYQIKRVAKAKAEAGLTEAQSQIEITDLHRRAAHRWIEEEARNQKNMEDITEKALPLLKETANPEAVDDDWIVHFFDQCRKVNSQQMQQLWSLALAGEANSPGSFSKRTVTALAALEASEAKWFTDLCGYGVVVKGSLVPLIFDVTDDIYRNRQVSFLTLGDLASIGMIRVGGVAGFQVEKLPREFRVHYYGRALQLRMSKESDNHLGVGKVLLTRIGTEIAPICGSRPVDGFWDYVRTQWKAHLPIVEGKG